MTIFNPGSVSLPKGGLGADFKLIQCAMHGENRGIENVDFIDFFGSYDAYSPSYSIALNNLTKLITFLL